MVVHRLRVVPIALFCGCVLAAAGCGGPGTTTTTYLIDTGVSTTTEAPTVTTETVQLYRVQVDGMWGFIDETGAIRIQPAFDCAYCGFSNGLAPVDPTGDAGYRFGYIDTSGDMAIEPRFLSAEPFSDDMAAVGTVDQGDGGKWGAIDTSGALVVPMQYETPPIFSEGRAAVRLAGAWYFVDKRGVAVLGPFESASGFSMGLAYVDRGDKRGYIDTSGDMAIELPDGLAGQDWPEKGFSEGLALVWSRDGASALCGYIDESGAVVIEPQFPWASAFSEGLAPAATDVGGEVEWGFIDKKGEWTIEPRFDAVSPFSEGFAVVMQKQAYAGVDDFETYGYIDRTGRIVIPVQYSEASSFSGGIAAVVFRDAPSGAPAYIDTTGTVIWPAE